MRRRNRILCVDDHPFVAEGLRARVALEADLEWAGWLPSAAGLLQEVRRLNPDVVLLDIEMPGPDPFEVVKDLHDRHPEVKALLLSAYIREHYFEAAVKGGAWGYLSKTDPPERIVAGIRQALMGQFAVSPAVQERCRLLAEEDGEEKPASKLKTLTEREQQILRMIGRGMSRAEIAKTIFRSPKTVDAHRTALMEKLGIHDRVDLVRYAIREGLVEP